MTPEQLTQIEAKLKRAKEICEQLTFLKNKVPNDFNVNIYYNGKSIPIDIQVGIIDRGMEAYVKILEKELNQIEINTKEKEDDTSNRGCAET